MRGRIAALACSLAIATSAAAIRQDEPPDPGTDPEGSIARHEDAAFVPIPWALPPANNCRPEGRLKGWPPGQDAPPIPFDPGETFSLEELSVLRSFLPPFIWEYRERFFHEGITRSKRESRGRHAGELRSGFGGA